MDRKAYDLGYVLLMYTKGWDWTGKTVVLRQISYNINIFSILGLIRYMARVVVGVGVFQ